MFEKEYLEPGVRYNWDELDVNSIMLYDVKFTKAFGEIPVGSEGNLTLDYTKGKVILSRIASEEEIENGEDNDEGVITLFTVAMRIVPVVPF